MIDLKRFAKLLVSVLFIFSLVLSLCSCKELDEWRDSRAVYNETDGVLIFRGNEYKLLPACEYLHIEPYNDGIITEEDVPILLSDLFGRYMSFDNNAEYIYYISNDKTMIYCRADRYDEICEKIETLEMNNYCYYNSDYYGDADSGNSRYSLLSENATEIMHNTLVGEGVMCDLKYEDVNILNWFMCCDETVTFVDSQNNIAFAEQDGEYSLMVPQLNGKYFKYVMSSEDALNLISIFD